MEEQPTAPAPKAAPAAVEGRFKLNEVARIACYSTAAGKYTWVEGRRVKLTAAQRPPFGSATPSGELTMTLAAPEAIAMFDGAAIGSEFSVVFAPAPPDPPEQA